MYNITKVDLAQFTGATNWYKHNFSNVVYTDGVKYLADNAGAYWLIDTILSYHSKKEFQIWKLIKTKDDKAVLTMQEDSILPILIKQKIPFTDFPFDEIKLYLADGVLFLPSEY